VTHPVTAQVGALMEGVLKGMILTKLKTFTAVLLLTCLIGVGGATLTRPRATAAQVEDPASTKPVVPQAKQFPKSMDETLLHGEWVAQVKDVRCSIVFGPGNRIQRIVEGRDTVPDEVAGTYSVDWKRTPHRLEVQWGSLPASGTIMDFPAKYKL